MNNNLSLNENKINEEEIKETLEKIDENDEKTLNQTSNIPNNSDEFRSKMIKMFGIVILALIVVLIIGFIISLFTKKNYTYAEVEDIMKNASINYFNDNKNKLPKDKSEIVEVDSNVLANNKYMKTLDKYLKNSSCSGKVSVEKLDKKSYNYTPILSCKDYTTTKLYTEITKKDNIVTDGFGLYSMNNEYVYRGSNVNNYIKFSDSDILWRIIKTTTNGEIVLITDSITNNSFGWDERYNSQLENNNGIGIYKNSNIENELHKIYNNKISSSSPETFYSYDEIEFLTKDDKTKLVEFNSCVGPRSESDTTKDGSTECKVIVKTKISMLPIYDFLNASLDVNCTSTKKQDCQNYNYLATKDSYWMVTPSDQPAEIYSVLSPGYIESFYANTTSSLRPVVHLSENVMLEKGKGTKDNPYVIR